jgi:hypothetical protein
MSSLSSTAGETAERVKVVTLDSLRERFSRVDFIKIDVEGFELSVLRGAQRLLEEHLPIVCFELTPLYSKRYGYGVDDFWHLLRPLGYTLKWINQSRDQGKLITSIPSNEAVAIPASRIQQFRDL